MEIVSVLRAAVADKVGKERFELWFGTSSRLELDGNQLTVVVPNRFFQQWLRSNFSRHIESACRETLGRVPALEFRVDATLQTGPDPSAAGNEESAPTEPAESEPATSPSSQPRGANGHPHGSRRRFADLQSFVTGPSNQLAWAAAEAASRRPGEMSPLLLYGSTGVGKTHLLEGVRTEVRRRHRGMTAVYLSAEQFTSSFLHALRGSGLPSFRRKYRGVDLLILDDLQFFSGKRCTQIELLYTVDTLLREGRQLVLAADRSPAELSDLGPELASRLAGGMVCRIEPPDHDTRLGIITGMARRLAVSVPEEVSRYIAAHLTSHARELSGALCSLQATSRAYGKPITLRMAEDVLSEMIRSSNPVVRLTDIEKAVCETFGLEPSSLQSGRKAKSVSHPRMLAMWLARKYTRSALSEISSFFGRRSHSTVISAHKRVDRWLADGVSLEMADHTWNVDEAIQQVERRLKTG